MVSANIRITITIRPRVSRRLCGAGVPPARRRFLPDPDEVGVDTRLIVSRGGALRNFVPSNF
jgi:hypothetical protein